MDKNLYEDINQICYKKKQLPDTKAIYEYLIKVDGLVDMTFEALGERIRTLEMAGKTINKKFYDADLFYIGHKSNS